MLLLPASHAIIRVYILFASSFCPCRVPARQGRFIMLGSRNVIRYTVVKSFLYACIGVGRGNKRAQVRLRDPAESICASCPAQLLFLALTGVSSVSLWTRTFSGFQISTLFSKCCVASRCFRAAHRNPGFLLFMACLRPGGRGCSRAWRGIYMRARGRGEGVHPRPPSGGA